MKQPHPAIEVLLDQRRFEQAESLIREELAQRPEDAWLLLHLALCFFMTGRADAALQVVEQAIRQEPDYAHAHFVRGVILQHLAQTLPPPEKSFRLTWYPPPHPLALAAEESFTQALRLEPDSEQYHLGRAKNLVQLRRMDAARDAVEHGLTHSPEDPGLLNLLATICREQGQLGAAQDATLRALAGDPDDVMIHANRGWTLLRTGQNDEAQKHFRESLRLYPHSTWARLGMQETLKRRFKPYGWCARGLHWLGQYDPRGQIRNGWIIAGLLTGSTLGAAGLLYVALTNTQESITLLQIVAASFLILFAGLIGVMLFVLVSLLARASTEISAAVLLFSADGRRTLDHSEKHRWLAVTLGLIWCFAVFLAFAFLPKTSRLPFGVLIFGGIGVLIALAWGLDQLRSRGTWFWLGFGVALAGGVVAMLSTDRAGDSPEWVAFCWIGSMVGAIVMYVFLEDPETVRAEQ